MKPISGIFGIALFLLGSGLGGFAFGASNPGDYHSVQTPKEVKIEKLRNEEIRAVRVALGLRNPENRKAELYLRLSELYLEAYRADFLLEGRLHEKALEKNPGARLVKSRSVEDLQNGIGAAETILGLKVETAKLDRVYYFLGYNYAEFGDKKKSKEYYDRLMKQFPSSGYTGEAIRALADEAFQNGDFADAERQYESAVKRTDDPAQQARINHKLAWCYYRQKRTKDAVDTMKRAIQIARAGGRGEKLLSVREEGLRDLAVYYAELGQVDEALDYFKQNVDEKDKLARVLEKLGKEYERTGQVEMAKKVYEVLLRADRRDESIFRVAVKMVDLDLLKEDFQSAANRIRVMDVPKSNDPDTLVAIVNLKHLVRSTAVNNHERYRRKDDKKEGLKFLQASDLFYTLYLEKFIPADPGSRAELNEIRRYLAEVKQDLGEPGQAAELYKMIIQDRDQKYAKEAAQLWVGSLDSEMKRRSAAGEKSGISPSRLELDFTAASDLLEKSLPNTLESRETRLRAAQILGAYPAEKGNAIRRASELVQDSPQTPQGVLAARLWIQLQPDAKALSALAANSALLNEDRKLNGDLARDLEEVAKKVRVNEISGLEKSKEFHKAGKAYEDYARTAKTEKEAESAYLGALSSYAQDGKSDEVLRVMKEWRLRFPKSRLVEGSVKSQATQYFIRGWFNDSAELFLGIGKLLRDRASYLTSAALFSGGLQYKKADQVYRQALALTPNDEGRAQIFKLIAMNALDERDEAQTLLAWKECAEINSALKAECLSQVGNVYLNHQDDVQAKERFESVLRIQNGPSAGSPYIAYAQFRLAQFLEKAMKNRPLEFPEENLRKGFDARFEELRPVMDAYQKAIHLSGPWGIAATERIGDLELGLAGELDRIVSDSRLTPGYRRELSEISKKLKGQATETASMAYSVALKSADLSSALPVIQDRLVDADTPGFQRSQGGRSGIKLIGLDPDGGKLGKEQAMRTVREELLKSQENALAWIDYGNLLWGLGKPGLSKVAYERSLNLRTRWADAQNNLAVVLVSDLGFENWYAANEAVEIWKKALQREPKNSAALFNLGHIFNYYRLFKNAVPYLVKVSKKVKIPEVYDELSVAYWGLGKKAESELNSGKAETLGLKSDRFTKLYRMASAAAGEECQKKLDSIPGLTDLKGFERISVNRLKQRCVR